MLWIRADEGLALNMSFTSLFQSLGKHWQMKIKKNVGRYKEDDQKNVGKQKVGREAAKSHPLDTA